LRFEEIPEAPRLAHAYAQSEARDTVVESRHFGRHRVHWREHGSGPPLLLVHGLMTTSYSWRYVIEPLGRRFRVIAPDLPGCGRSDKPDVRYRGGALATWLGEFCDEVGIRGCVAIGNSLGGYLCMQAALADPRLFARLVNVHSPGVPEPRLWALSAALSVPGVAAMLARWVRRDPERWAHANVHYWDETLKSREEAREYGAPLATIEGSRAFTRYLADTVSPTEMRALVRALEQRRAEGSGFPVPLLLVYSRVDPMVPPRIGEQLSALLPGAPLVWLDDSSHFAHVDSPERLLEPVLAFLG
jgi:pimeloyl-ACP methyl ester carboxylesterase